MPTLLTSALAALVQVPARRRGQGEGGELLLGRLRLLHLRILVVTGVAGLPEDDGRDEVVDDAVDAAALGGPGEDALEEGGAHLARREGRKERRKFLGFGPDSDGVRNFHRAGENMELI